ncbi:MAG: hypothetical protein U0821_01285 [Chloroflexota bacterium]
MFTFRIGLLILVIAMLAVPAMDSAAAGGLVPAELLRGKTDKDQREKGDKNADKQSELDGNGRNVDKGRKFGNDARRTNNDNGELKEGELTAQRNEEKTNVLPLSDYEIQGYVTSLDCSVAPKLMVIRTLDGLVNSFQMIDPRDKEYKKERRVDLLRCGDLAVGDYVFIQEAEKINEGLYNAFHISCTGKRDDERRNNSNDNDEIDDPNCRYILSRPNQQ